jgi:hypothetical protein
MEWGAAVVVAAAAGVLRKFHDEWRGVKEYRVQLQQPTAAFGGGLGSRS